MFKKIILVFSLFTAFTSQAQLKTFTLDEAVMQQSRAFRADKLVGFQWIPNTTNYVYYTDANSKMMQASAKDSKAKELATLTEINSALGTKLKSFAGLEWIDSTSFLISENGKYYIYSITSKTGKNIQVSANSEENQTFDSGKNNLAFTVDNNLYFYNKNKEKVTVTNESNKGIVSGQSISRNEFGISNGIFWSPKSSYLAFYQKDQSEVADYPLLDINETPGKLENLKYPMIGQKSEKPRVGIYNLSTGKTVFIAPKSGNANDYLTNLSWTPDEKYVLIAELNREQNDMYLNVYDANSGAFIRTILNEKNNAWVEPEHEAFFPNANSNNFVWFSEKEGFHNLYYYTIDGKLIKQLTNNKFPAREIIGTNPAGTEIYFKATGANATNMLVYKVTLGGKQTLITKEEGVHSVAVSTDGKWFFDEFSNHSTPSKSLLYDAKLNATILLVS
jgi:dipeptidyl-peptidase-4